MSFFDKIGEKIAQTSQSAAQKTKNTAETIKLKSMISDEEKRINNAFHQIGELYYETFGENPEQPFVQLITNIKDSEGKIATYTDQINQLRGVLICQNCGGEAPDDASFCCSCGTAISIVSEDSASEDSASEISCGQCGFIVAPDLPFCTNCGNRINSDSDPAEPIPVEPDPAEPVIEDEESQT